MNKDELIKELQEKLEKVSKEKEQLEKKVKDLENQLAFFNNPHTPPSKQVFKTRTHQASSKKLGAPCGHKGATRKIPGHNEVVNHFLKRCPRCNDVLCKPFEFEERIVEEIPEPQPVKITKHVIGFYNCKNCGIVCA